MITEEELKNRLHSVQTLMEEEGLEALIFAASSQLDQKGLLRWLLDYYLPVFEESAVVLADGNIVYFAHDGLSAAHAADSPLQPETRVIPPDLYYVDPAKPTADFLKSKGAKRVGIAGLPGISANYVLSLKRHYEGAITDMTQKAALLRMVKSPAEIQLTREAVQLNEDTFYAYIDRVRSGAYEKDALAAGYGFAARAGAEDQYWMCGSGKPAVTAPAAVAKLQDHRWKEGEYHSIVIEHSSPGGHYGEICQVLKIGNGSTDRELEKAQKAVVEAILAAVKLIRPGNTVGQVAAEAERCLIEGGFMKARPAGSSAAPIGHGQGLDFWEIPSIAADNPQVIVPGMRFNLHPGVTMKNGTKVTFCDCYLSTEGEAERLSTLSYDVIYRP